MKHHFLNKSTEQQNFFFGNFLATNEQQIKMLVKINSAHFIPLIYKTLTAEALRCFK